MGEYAVKVTPRAMRDLEGIYAYIFHELKAPETAVSMIELLEMAIYTQPLLERGVVSSFSV